MIYTVTFNPALDYVMETDEILSGQLNRSYDESIFMGGKGINVSLMLSELDINSIALGFVAGFTGDALEKGLLEKGIATDFVHLSRGLTRINVKLKTESGNDTEINANGPDISDDDIKKLYKKLLKLKGGDIIVLSGSIPSNLPQDIYSNILKHLSDRDIKAVIDAGGELLVNTLEFKPYLIKPNLNELEQIFNRHLIYMNDIKDCARILQEKGARNVLVSMADKGAMLLDECGNYHQISAFGGRAVSSVGAGDSMVAGFLAGSKEGSDLYSGLIMGCASGAATAFTNGIGKGDVVRQLYNSYIAARPDEFKI